MSGQAVIFYGVALSAKDVYKICKYAEDTYETDTLDEYEDATLGNVFRVLDSASYGNDDFDLQLKCLNYEASNMEDYNISYCKEPIHLCIKQLYNAYGGFSSMKIDKKIKKLNEDIKKKYENLFEELGIDTTIELYFGCIYTSR